MKTKTLCDWKTKLAGLLRRWWSSGDDGRTTEWINDAMTNFDYYGEIGGLMMMGREDRS